MLFKKYGILWALALAALLVVCTVIFFQLTAGSFVFLLSESVLVAAIAVIWVHFTKQSEKQTENISDNICDPFLYANIQKEIIQSDYAFPKTKEACKLRLMDALMDLGEYATVPPILQNINIQHKGFLQIYYLTTLITYYFNTGENEKAEQSFNELRASKNEYKKDNVLFQRITELELDIQKNLLFSNKQYDQCVAYFHSILESPNKPNRMKAYTAYKLGVIAIHDRDKKRARQYFDDVVKYGNKMSVVEQAKILLNLL